MVPYLILGRMSLCQNLTWKILGCLCTVNLRLSELHFGVKFTFQVTDSLENVKLLEYIIKDVSPTPGKHQSTIWIFIIIQPTLNWACKPILAQLWHEWVHYSLNSPNSSYFDVKIDMYFKLLSGSGSVACCQTQGSKLSVCVSPQHVSGANPRPKV